MFSIKVRFTDFGWDIIIYSSGDSEMKRKGLLALIMLTCMLTSCEAHWENARFDVPWWIVAIFCVVVFLIAHLIIIRKSYRCPRCNTVFHPRWYEFSSWLHHGNQRAMKCPHCHRQGFFSPSDEGGK